jgi:dinuclear metal center YbgI/SA1388 family protein
MADIREICEFLDELAPARLAEDWDNVGLLVGDPARPAQRVMTCLTVTPDSAQEAVQERADLIVTHHPLPFRPLDRLTVESTAGRLLWELIGARISVFRPHTSWDSACDGINQQLAVGMGLQEIRPLTPTDPLQPDEGSGRWGQFPSPKTLAELIKRTQQFLSIQGLHYVGKPSKLIRRAAVACGSAGQFLQPAQRAGCELLLTGETSFHGCLEAAALGVALILPGHYASERFAVETLAEQLQRQFPAVQVWASRTEQDPLIWAPNGIAE